MLDGNAAYLEANIADSTFINLRLNLILFVSTTGQVVFGRGFEAQHQQAIPASLTTQLIAHPALWHPADINGNTVGIVALPQGVLLAASRPILTNEQTGPSHGTLLFGRWLDVAEIERLSSIAHVSMSVLPWDAPALPPDDQAAQAALSDQLPISVRPLDDQTIAGYTRVTDIDGQPALLLRVTVPRLIYAQGQSTLTYFALSLLAVGVVFSVLMPLLLERLVLSRLRKLNASVSAIEHSGDHIARVPAAGRDELANLGQAINAMLDTLQHSAETLRDSEQRYRLLFENMQTGFAYCQMIYDDHDHPDDFIYLDVNSAFEHLTGLKNVLGKKVTEVIPGIKELTPDLFEIYSRVARTGQPEKFELDFTPLAMWLSISVYSTAHGYFAVVFDNITNRKQAEAAEREQRELAEALRDTAAALNSTLNFDEVLDRILISMERVLPFDAADILLLNDDRTTATVARHRSHHDPDHIAEITQWQVAVAQSRNLREMLDTGQPVIV
ncbi:MAG TPA: CHASE4 domain-containing protein, partial [Anaerolineae bacterium]|nr:CHASE4 domain-containing protein [Anaerolineae bacterium]